jgi:hypothetical protein
MLAAKFTEDTPLPLAGSHGYLRGTAARARVLRRNGDRTCLVQLFERNLVTRRWDEVRGASGTTTVPEGDLYATEREAAFCGRKVRLPRNRRSART